MHRLFVTGILVSALAVSSCDNGPAVTEADEETVDTTTSTTATTVVENLPAAAEGYLRAFASNDPQTMLEMQDHAQRGSLASAYAVFQQATTEALQQGGPPPPDPVEVTGNTVVLTRHNNDQPYDTAYGDFEVDPATGRLVNFTVNRTSLEGRLSLGGPPVTDQGITVAPFSAYQSIERDTLSPYSDGQATESDALYIVFDVTNSAGQPFNIAGGGAYVAPDTALTHYPITANGVCGGPEPCCPPVAGRPEMRRCDPIAASDTARITVAFRGVPPGGQFSYGGWLDGFDTEVNFTVRIPAS